MMRPAVLTTLVVAAAASIARAQDMEGDLLYLPMPAGESLSVRNPLGAVRLRGWDQPQVRIMAEKRAGTSGLVDRLKVHAKVENGKLEIVAGVYLKDNTWHPVPLDDARIDLTIDAPRRMTLAASTFTGDIDAEGFRAGAHLASERGEIRAADIDGPVETRSLDGKQSLQAIHGRLAASGVDGDMELESIEGDTIDATVYKGQITAREVRTPVVRLRATVGTIVFIGGLRPGGRYELGTYEGDVRLTLRPSPFHLAARGRAVKSGFLLVGGESGPGFLRGDYDGGGASLELVSGSGTVSVERRQ